MESMQEAIKMHAARLGAMRANRPMTEMRMQVRADPARKFVNYMHAPTPGWAPKWAQLDWREAPVDWIREQGLPEAYHIEQTKNENKW